MALNFNKYDTANQDVDVKIIENQNSLLICEEARPLDLAPNLESKCPGDHKLH